ncbi:MAG: hypothetical protein ACREJN_02350, partial [Nitrospiraceae bacterium]
MLQKFFPEAFIFFENEEAAQQLRLGQQVAGERDVDANRLFALIRDTWQPSTPERGIYEQVIERIDAEEGRYRVTPSLPFTGIHRISVQELRLVNPVSKVWVLTGVPKIGKTSLLLQLASEWLDQDLRWYDCPIQDSTVAEAIALDLIRAVTGKINVNAYLTSDLKLQELLLTSSPPSRSFIYVIDNADRLSDESQKLLARVLLLIKQTPALMKRLAIVLVSNKRLHYVAAPVDETIVAPGWTAQELGTLIDNSSIPIDAAKRGEYLETLEVFSGGHPLIARALARKCPAIAQLLMQQLASVPLVADEDLSREVQSLLYNDILTDADSQNLVQRLSILAHPAKEELCQALRTKVEPQISKSLHVIVERLGDAVIEGHPTSGYIVPFVFRRIASQKISLAEKVAVYRVAADTLLKINGNVINAGSATEGIFYAVCANDLGRVSYWTTLLIQQAMKLRVPNEQFEALVSCLAFLAHLKQPEGFPAQFSHAVTMISLAMAYSQLEQHDKVAGTLDKVRIDSPSAPTIQEKEAINHIRTFLVIFRSMTAMRRGEDNAAKYLVALTDKDFTDASPENRLSLLEILSIGVGRFPLSDLPAEWLRNILDIFATNLPSAVEQEVLVKLASNLALRAKQERVTFDRISGHFPETGFGTVLRCFAEATLKLEDGLQQEALAAIDEAMKIADSLAVNNPTLKVKLYQVKGDAAYQIPNYQVAEYAYAESLEATSEGSFDEAWSSWRLGQLRNDEHLLSRSAIAFHGLKHFEYWARAWGARGALLVGMSCETEGIDCWADLLEAYYEGGQKEAGPATTVAITHMTRFKMDRTGEVLVEGALNYPNIEPSMYSRVLDTASPVAGPLGAYFILSEAYRVVGGQDESRKFLVHALSVTSSLDADRRVFPMVLMAVCERNTDVHTDKEIVRRCLELTIHHVQLSNRYPVSFLSYCVFHSLDSDTSLARLRLFTDILEEVLYSKSDPDPYWTAELLLRKAKLLRLEGIDETQQVALYRKALDAGRANSNGAVIRSAAHALGFDLFDRASSILQLAEYHFEGLLGYELDEFKLPQLLDYGINLYRIWSRISFRWLRDVDLAAKNHLLEHAMIML